MGNLLVFCQTADPVGGGGAVKKHPAIRALCKGCLEPARQNLEGKCQKSRRAISCRTNLSRMCGAATETRRQ